MWGKKVKSHAEKIESAHSNVLSAVDVFEKAKQKVIAANEQLDEVVKDIEAELTYLQTVKAHAVEKRSRNEVLRSKFEDLTV